MKKNKVIALSLVLGLSLSFMTGCSQNIPTASAKTETENPEDKEDISKDKTPAKSMTREPMDSNKSASKKDAEVDSKKAKSEDTHAKNTVTTASNKNQASATIGNASAGASSNNSNSQTPASTGHYEDRYVIDEAAWDEPEYEEASDYVCNGCKANFGNDQNGIFSHNKEAALSGNDACGGYHVEYRMQPTGKVIHHKEVGHYEKVWVQ